MANLSKKLKSIFNEYLERLEYEKSHPSVRTPSSHYHEGTLFDEGFRGIIYFYEWSDINRAPKSFYTLKAFESFLMTSHIFMASYQKELIMHMHNPHIVCKKGSHELLIRPTYDKLKEVYDRETASSSLIIKGGDVREPYTLQISRPPTIQKPPMYCGSQGRWAEQEEYWDW